MSEKDSDKERVITDETDDSTPPSGKPATARRIPPPKTHLPVFPSEQLSSVTVSLIGDVESAPDLEVVEKTNLQGRDEPRTPLLTVVAAVLKREGGSAPLHAIAEDVVKYWNRPLPGGPYSTEEFLYMVIRGSDNIRTSS